MAEETKRKANPAALGLIGFGFTTVLWSLVNVGVLPIAGMSMVVLLAFVYGGATQFVAGIFEFVHGNTFGMTAFMSYGAFWTWFGLWAVLGGDHVLDITQADDVLDWSLVGWGIFTLYLWIAAFRVNLVVWLVLLTWSITYFLLGAGGLTGIRGLTVAGGVVGIICGGLAAYGAFAIVTNDTFGKPALPLVPFRG